ncbi:MAG: stress response translation initiation inhibitor YciH [Pseudomonadota bacterium]
MSKKTRLVFSTDVGKTCPDCEHAMDACVCANTRIVGDGTVRIQYETKGRKGKGVTVVSGIPLIESELKALAKTIKKKISTGGSVKDGVIEIQGDQRVAVTGFFEQYIKHNADASGWALKGKKGQ